MSTIHLLTLYWPLQSPAMSCGCGKSHRAYLVTKKDGSQETVDTLTAAMKIVRAHGGTYQIVKVDGKR